jgi:Na+/H+ antiporter NhaD/arsenite permease-like protein
MKFKGIFKFIKKEVVLVIAISLAIISAIIVPPSKKYMDYIDFRTLAILFCLMTVTAGLKRQGVFEKMGQFLLLKTRNLFQLILVLIMLCFFSGMIITNDVALITFVPFTFVVFNMLREEQRKKLILPVICIQTIAANMGSMLTPLGNPQNLYLYCKSGMSLGRFCLIMLPYTVVSLALIILWTAFISRKVDRKIEKDWIKIENVNGDKKRIVMHFLMFILCLLVVLRIIDYKYIFVITLLANIIFDRKTVKNVDYSLLFMFIGFFIFVGNIRSITAFSNWINEIINGNEIMVAVLSSQIISNVPTALLLSGFTDKIRLLVIGTNIGGLGTLIASMASLISYRQIVRELPGRKGEYFKFFTIANIVFLIIMLMVRAIIK